MKNYTRLVMTNVWKFQLSSSNGLGFMMFRRSGGKGWLTLSQWICELQRWNSPSYTVSVNYQCWSPQYSKSLNLLGLHLENWVFQDKVYIWLPPGVFFNITQKAQNYPDGVFLVSPWLIESRSYKKVLYGISHIMHHKTHSSFRFR